MTEQNLIDKNDIILQKSDDDDKTEIIFEEKKKIIDVSSWTYAQIRETINDKCIGKISFINTLIFFAIKTFIRDKFNY